MAAAGTGGGATMGGRGPAMGGGTLAGDGGGGGLLEEEEGGGPMGGPRVGGSTGSHMTREQVDPALGKQLSTVHHLLYSSMYDKVCDIIEHAKHLFYYLY